VTLSANVIMLGVHDLARAKEFYRQLGATIEQDYPTFVSFSLGQGSSALGLYPWDAAATEAGQDPEGSGFRGVSLHCLVGEQSTVDELLKRAVDAGGSEVRPGAGAQWGGYFGYFADPDGYLWKVACPS
jgi:predicted lactoylglutathione lyase